LGKLNDPIEGIVEATVSATSARITHRHDVLDIGNSSAIITLSSRKYQSPISIRISAT
jgi:hypothetical protein